MHNFKKLTIWKKSMDLVTEIYVLTNKYPKHEIYGLTSQTRRAAVSVPLNISEGSAKSSNKDFARFLEMAIGSINELETVLIVAYNIQYIDFEHLNEFQEKITILRKMISKFKDSLEE
ncbi:23Sr RNA [uncultured Paludibacter sp.]|uniref:23Sr RNA n=1 Tax=uncultured Paludibacter sp. TaxID=497635 RepID=A0A653ACL1_9BACT|nr:23Sr RNA [uncultured Paludibacter sp.]